MAVSSAPTTVLNAEDFLVEMGQNLPISIAPPPSPEQKKRCTEDDVNDCQHFRYFMNIKANEIFTKCCNSSESLEDAFKNAAIRGNSAMSAWWAEIQNELPKMIKFGLDEEERSGTPIDHLKLYVIKVQRTDSMLLSWNSRHNPKILALISPIEFDITKLGRKLYRQATTLRNQTNSLENGINSLLSNWEQELLANQNQKLEIKVEFPGTVNGKLGLKSLNSTGNKLQNAWTKVRSFVSRKRNDNSGCQREGPDCSAKLSSTSRSEKTLSAIEIRKRIKDSLVSGHSRLTCTFTNSLEKLSNIHINQITSGESTPTEYMQELGNNSSALPAKNAEGELTPNPELWTTPVSNANSKANWLSHSEEDLQISDSDTEISNQTQSADEAELESRISKSAVFVEEFLLNSSENHNLENLTENVGQVISAGFGTEGMKTLVDPGADDFEDDRSSFHAAFDRTATTTRREQNDSFKALKDFTQRLHAMIKAVTMKCRTLELGFFQVVQIESWCNTSHTHDIGDIIKTVIKCCDELSNPILASELCTEDKVELTEKLMSLLRASEKCLHIVQDLNHVVNSERKAFRALLKYCTNYKSDCAEHAQIGEGVGKCDSK